MVIPEFLSSLSRMSVTRDLGLYLYSQDESNNALSPILYSKGNIASSVNTRHSLLISLNHRR